MLLLKTREGEKGDAGADLYALLLDRVTLASGVLEVESSDCLTTSAKVGWGASTVFSSRRAAGLQLTLDLFSSRSA